MQDQPRQVRIRLLEVSATIALVLTLTASISYILFQQRLSRDLHRALERDDSQTALNRMRQGANPRTQSSYGRNTLVVVTRNGSPDEVREVLARGVPVNTRDSTGCTPLHYAVARGRHEVALLLLKAGADVNAPDNSGTTPLMWAVATGNREITEAILDRNPDVNQRNQRGQTAESIARRKGYSSLTRLLQHASQK
jgi:ankyrin repeat protein